MLKWVCFKVWIVRELDCITNKIPSFYKTQGHIVCCTLPIPSEIQPTVSRPHSLRSILILYSQLQQFLLSIYLRSELLRNNTTSRQQLINNSSEHERPWSPSVHSYAHFHWSYCKPVSILTRLCPVTCLVTYVNLFFLCDADLRTAAC
jgi:hypothetical protein